MNKRSTMNKLAVAALVAATAVPAHAWGPREQAALTGVAGVLILQHIIRVDPRLEVRVEPPVNVLPPASLDVPIHPYPRLPSPVPRGRTCLQHPFYDQYGRLLGYQLSCH